MTQIVRYFHIRTGTKGGATVKVIGDTSNIGQVDVQYSLCSRKDSFVKKIGRSCANHAPVKVVPLRYLPKELDLISKKATDWGYTDWNFAIKYFLPRE